MQGFLLGISHGTLCVAYCAPVLVPYMLGERGSVRGNASLLVQFLAGRLLGYLCFAVLAWIAGTIMLHNTVYQGRILGLAYIILAGLLFMYSVCKPKDSCALNLSKRYLGCFSTKWYKLFPVVLGVLTGVNICPPFLLVFTEAANAENLGGSFCFFFTFFLGTSLYFLPIPFLGFLNRFSQLQIIGKITTALMAFYYWSIGAMLLGGR